MGILVIVLSQLVHAIEGICTKNFGRRHREGGMLFSAIISLFSMIYFIISDNNGFNFPPELWPYGLIGCLLYAAGFYFTFVAIKNGSYALSVLILSYSGIFSIIYGLAFLKEQASITTYVGIALIFVSIFFINYIKADKSEKIHISAKWLISILIALVSNGMIAVISILQQIQFEDLCTNEFMIISLGGSFILLLIMGIIKDIRRLGHIVKHGGLYAMCGGLSNGITNFLILRAYLLVPISIAAPISAGLKILITLIVSVALFREKLTKQQLLGVVFGATGLILLNI